VKLLSDGMNLMKANHFVSVNKKIGDAMKYYDDRKVELGDICQGAWCGTCRVIELDESSGYAELMNINTDELFKAYEEDGSMGNCDFIRKGL
jgi:ferredoxin